MAGFSWRYDPKTQEFRKVFLLAGNVIQDASYNAVKRSADAGVKAGQQSIAGAGFSNRWVRSLRFKMVTPKGTNNPVAYVHTTINFADVFERGADIHGDPLLWIPLPSVPGSRGRKHMSPAQYVKNIGPLTLIRRPGKVPLLAAAIKRGAKAQPFGKFATRGQLRRGTSAKTGRVEMIPLYVGVPAATIRKRWNVNAALQREANKMPQYYEEELRKLDQRNLLNDGN